MFYKIGVLKNFAKNSQEKLVPGPFLVKLQAPAFAASVAICSYHYSVTFILVVS